jgi:hypothetical protein
MKTLIGALAVICVLISTEVSAQRRLIHKSERFARQAECLKRANMKRYQRRPAMRRFETPSAARKRFMRECMKAVTFDVPQREAKMKILSDCWLLLSP